MYRNASTTEEPWDKASLLARALGPSGLRRAIYDQLRSPGVFQKGYPGLLQRGFVGHTASLRAVAAFAVSMVAYSVGQRGGGEVVYPRVTANPRVPAILTTNYDPYLEAAAFPQVYRLRHHTVLFVGFSFRDRWVRDLLRQIREERELSEKRSAEGRRTHFALLPATDVARRAADFFADLGVEPIPPTQPSEVVDVLSPLYVAGIAHDMDLCRHRPGP